MFNAITRCISIFDVRALLIYMLRLSISAFGKSFLHALLL